MPVQRAPAEAPECMPIDSTSVCSPFSSGLAINITAVSNFILLQPWATQPIATVADWSNAIEAVSDQTSSTLTALVSDICSTDSADAHSALEHRRSLLCAASLFVHSAGCNADYLKRGRPTVCEVTFQRMTDELEELFNNWQSCPSFGTADARGKLQQTVKDAMTMSRSDGVGMCVSVVDGDRSARPPVDGGQTDEVEVRKPNNRLFAPARQPSTNSRLFNKAAENTSSSSSSTVSLPLIIGVSVGGVVLVAGLLTVFLRRRRSSSLPKHFRGLPRGTTTSPGSRNPGALAAFGGPAGSDASLPLAPSSMSGAVMGARLVRVKHPYTAELPDEVDLRVGDLVEVERRYDDDWGKGLNTRTGMRGHFPLAVLGAE
ncbi:hypothetical protein HK101_003299 [Irineochytrium annulatum]|nr:hypothetical protein HK101_003299 [Irineochytrium annulatum]